MEQKVNELPDPTQMSALREEIGRLSRGRAGAVATVPVGHPGVDRALGGGLARGRLHEVVAAETADETSAAGFAAMLAARVGGLLVWLRAGEPPHAPGLREVGVDPANLLAVRAPDAPALLRAAGEVARCPDVGVAVVEAGREARLLDLVATRRLALAVEGSGATLLLVRTGEGGPSAAQTRWGVRSAPSAPLEADAPGWPTLDLELLRRRGGVGGGPWRLEWDRDRAIFRDPIVRDGTIHGPALPGAVVPLPCGRPAEGERRRA